ncbi:molybdenum cofactor synthesis domain-containing protein [Caloramator quimbayensis]|uniref:Molybdopterin molybdenumtransferase n=1 Tax=Caloramator quimbayensis TaxID=1147123 RepID=A0A1T4Y763_9CLOT|nr:molybdopterin-binding protein [Caloramator quimbayensis]SKA97674.1 molybdenum cofactor synthesis domain-containing protein [Caloramator quimbayensis]
MKKVKVEDAVGMVLAHDLTKIVPNVFKGAAFKKGHIIEEKDILELKSMGKNHIYILELNENIIHEDEAAIRIAKAAAGKNIYLQGPSEGKINFRAEKRGLLKVNEEALYKINSIEMIMFATLHNNTVVDKDKSLGGTRIIPLTIEKEKIEEVENICREHGSILDIKEFNKYKVGIIVTGTEVFEGRITDKFGPVLKNKMEYYGCENNIKYAPDDKDRIIKAIESHINEGCDIIILSGGMSVDADDVTPSAIREYSTKVITYGSPVLPGAMFMMAYKNNTPIVGIPACGMYHKITIFDLVFPRIIAGEVIKREDIVRLGHGGFCENCSECRFPSCSFGK